MRGPQGSSFGISTSLSGDASRLVVGAETYDTQRGAVYFYSQNASGLFQLDDGPVSGKGTGGYAIYSRFGSSVSMARNGLSLVVGADNDPTPSAQDDSMFVYAYNTISGVWEESVSRFRAPARTGQGTLQGYSVALSCDGSTLVEGGPGYEYEPSISIGATVR